eukprot:scaffold22998_cov129-Isochrysis_galbana.AAC.1
MARASGKQGRGPKQTHLAVGPRTQAVVTLRWSQTACAAGRSASLAQPRGPAPVGARPGPEPAGRGISESPAPSRPQEPALPPRGYLGGGATAEGAPHPTRGRRL